MNILEKIVAQKQLEVVEAKKQRSISELEQEVLFRRKGLSLTERLKGTLAPGIIAEFKRKSPSKGIINDQVLPEVVTKGYAQAGASALSVLTDTPFFGGTFDDFRSARQANPEVPLLRKDFMVDEYQLFEAKALGADIILLIAACLSPQQVRSLSRRARELDLEVLLEVHDAEELDRSLCDDVNMVGVNNRNLKTFVTSISTSLELAAQIPNSFVKISESGLQDAETIRQLYQQGYRGFLIGETFMKTSHPGQSLADLREELNRIVNHNPSVV
ncbi:indole-3-glycerol phosphate synthase [Rhabdobacter roseus]|uniref:Indole-3-glycerol phosphate synthase n=1 Tax=Rhabdobacter roseus TaxID=1655419 RepID=A0A840U704_9BACT|nr:indole-3-glycerol phosphate synthase TrpC [Rhabdobacter roseus]MBB5287599.1 indole-3-glycerol phosphate synthase [Rhabdobacter roseus]